MKINKHIELPRGFYIEIRNHIETYGVDNRYSWTFGLEEKKIYRQRAEINDDSKIIETALKDVGNFLVVYGNEILKYQRSKIYE